MEVRAVGTAVGRPGRKAEAVERAMAEAVRHCLEAGLTDPGYIREAQLRARATLAALSAAPEPFEPKPCAVPKLSEPCVVPKPIEPTGWRAVWLRVRRWARRLLTVGALLCSVASVASGQTIVVNPTTVVFLPSADHQATVQVEGQPPIPAVTFYELRIYLPGASAPLSIVGLGKPSPDPNTGEITARPAELVGLPLGAYVARVAAVGPGGEGVSAPTAPFVRITPPAPPTQVRVGS